jgi:PAS domain-containing protein
MHAFITQTQLRLVEPQPHLFRSLDELDERTQSFVALDAAGRIRWVSQPMAELLNESQKNLLGRTASDFLHPDQVDFACELHNMFLDGLNEVTRGWTIMDRAGVPHKIHADILRCTGSKNSFYELVVISDSP